MLVAVVAKWVAIAFSSVEKEKADVYRCSKNEYEKALEDAKSSIWICQTWLPSPAVYTNLILKKKRRDLRILLASFKPNSHIYARILGRPDIGNERDAMTMVKTCVAPFVEKGLGKCIKFNYGHHPGWITVIDKRVVYWGPTPVDIDNNTYDFFFHKDTIKGEWGDFWKCQFEILWDRYSHDLNKEEPFNPELASLKRA